MPPTPTDPTLWQRIKAGARRLLPRAWRGESVGGIDDPGYPVSPLDLYDGMKGIDHSLVSLVAAWRRRRPGPEGQPISATPSDAAVRDLARLLERYNPFAQAVLTALRSFVLGDKGLVVEVQVREGVTPSSPDQMLLSDAQAYLDAFMDAGDWWSRERELYVRCRRDGEGILRYFADRHGVKVRFIEPEWVVPPDGSAEWTEGVRTDPDDAEALEALWVQTGATPQEGEEVPAGETYFIKANVDACLKRGLSDFASTAALITRALDCLLSTIGAEAIRQGITYITQHENSAPADLDAMLASQSNYNYPADTSGNPARDGWGRGPTHAMPQVGEVHLTGTQKLAAVPQGNVGEAVNALNTALLSAAARYHMPLWVISGDASRNNALDLQAEGPFGRFVADEQAWYCRHVRNAMWRVLEIGVDRGDLPAATLEALDLAVTPQRPTEQRDPTQETERNKTLFEAGMLGKPTWAAREGLDFQQEQDDIKRYGGPPSQAPPGPGGPGGGAPAMPPGDRFALQPQTNGNGRGDFEAVLFKAARKAALAVAEQAEEQAAPNEDADEVDPGVVADLFYGLYGEQALEILQGLANPEPEPTGEAWDASSHPRGKGGRFIPKGSAEAVAAAQATVNRVLSGDASVEPKEVLDHLSILTVKQIHELAKKHGKTAPKLLRAELVDAVSQIMTGNKEAAAKAAPAADPIDAVMSAYEKHAGSAEGTVAMREAVQGIIDGLKGAEKQRVLDHFGITDDWDDPFNNVDDRIASAVLARDEAEPAPAKKAPAAKKAPKAKAAADPMAGHPHAGKSPAQMKQELAKASGREASHPNPHGYKADAPPAHADAVHAAVKDMGVSERGGTRPRLRDVYAKALEAAPGLTVRQFQDSLFTLQQQGRIRLDPFTGPVNSMKDEDAAFAMPLDRDVKMYVDAGPRFGGK